MIDKFDKLVKRVDNFCEQHEKLLLVVEIVFLCVSIIINLLFLYGWCVLMASLSIYIGSSDRQGLLSMIKLNFFTSILLVGFLIFLGFALYSSVKKMKGLSDGS